ncbi:hypothetical protein EBZ37_11780, partial [bacterium]|nr:hypothetical protein [bacterium]
MIREQKKRITFFLVLLSLLPWIIIFAFPVLSLFRVGSLYGTAGFLIESPGSFSNFWSGLF